MSDCKTDEQKRIDELERAQRWPSTSAPNRDWTVEVRMARDFYPTFKAMLGPHPELCIYEAHELRRPASPSREPKQTRVDGLRQALERAQQQADADAMHLGLVERWATEAGVYNPRSGVSLAKQLERAFADRETASTTEGKDG